MTEQPSRPDGRSGARGRIDKHQAILDAAFAVFARRGYAQAGVREIAEEAGVAKPTVYNHFADKESLFRQSMEAAAEAVLAENLAALARLRGLGDLGEGADLGAALEDAAHRMITCCCGERSRALRWLTYAQVARFPDVIVAVQGRTSSRLTEALADRLARLSLSGRLRACDPALAAEQFLALLTGPIEARSGLGIRTVPAAEMRAVASGAVDTFLRAYGPESLPAR